VRFLQCIRGSLSNVWFDGDVTISKNFNARWIPSSEEDDDDDGIMRVSVLLFYLFEYVVTTFFFLSFFLLTSVCLFSRFRVFVDFRTFFFLYRKSFFFSLLFLFLHFFHSRRERRTRVFVRTLSITFLITRFLRRDRGTRLTRACIACASSVSVRFREKKNGRRVSLLSRKKKDRRADFF